MSKNLHNISVVAVATVVSRVLGLVREMATAAVFGTSALNSAFVSAFTLPNLFRRLLGEGALTAAFVPTLTHELEQQRRDGAFRLVSKVASWLVVVTTVIVGLAMVVFWNAESAIALASRWGVAEETGRRLLLGADLAVILFPYLIFVCLSAAFSAACQVLGRFAEPALSPIWLNVAILGALGLGAWWAWDSAARMQLLCVAVLVGGFWQMAVPATVLWREGWRPVFDLRPDERVREILRLMGPTVIGSAIYLINISVSRFLGLSLNDSAAAVLNLATRVMELPIGVFTIAIATVVFPLIARHAAREDWPALTASYHKGLRLVLVINIPAAAGLVLLSEPITRLLFERGAFQAADTRLMTPVLAVYALGLPFLSFTSLALRGFYALRDTATPVRAAALSFVVNLVLSLLLMGPLSTVGLALASTIAVFVQMVFLQVYLGRKHAGFALAGLLPNLGKIALATMLMSLLVWGGNRFVGTWALAGKLPDVLVVVLVIPLAAALYGAALWWLRIEGRDELAQVLDRVRAKLSGKTKVG
ncbi:MAG: murein biosynthesis integral membrane protein MurJ [Candidatus Didemnitutus sp.]|nr:murein biosynthesis integral membrane protein MurJ [Candidatus Didemnitutus sp.]